MSRDKKIYLDYNATTPVDPRVLDEMLPYFTDKFGNASSINHKYGWEAEEGVELAREQVARLTGATPTEICFTSGATEAINLALLGVSRANQQKGNHIVTCVTEHKATLETCQKLEEAGCRVTYLPVDQAGAINLEELKNSITDNTILVTLMHANNEIGVIHPLEEISTITKQADVLLMTDATQSVGKIPFDADKLGVDLAAFSSHKLYGPKGGGALYVTKKNKPQLSPLFYGGGQEKGLRPGTLNVPAIVGFGKACEICQEEMEADSIRLNKLRNLIETELAGLEGMLINAQPNNRLPYMTSLSFPTIDGSKLVRFLKNLAFSRGSACTSAIQEPSHVLKALGHSDRLALSTIRLGLGRFTTGEEIRAAINYIKEAIPQLKRIA